MINKTISRKYATVLFKYVCTQTSGPKRTATLISKIYDNLLLVQNILEHSKLLSVLLSSRAVELRQKHQGLMILKQEVKIEPVVMRLLEVITQYNHLEHFGYIIHGYKEMFDEFKGVKVACITFAQSPSATQQKEIVALLEKRFNFKCEPTIALNPELIGGFSAYFSGMFLDASIKNALTYLSQK